MFTIRPCNQGGYRGALQGLSNEDPASEGLLDLRRANCERCSRGMDGRPTTLVLDVCLHTLSWRKALLPLTKCTLQQSYSTVYYVRLLPSDPSTHHGHNAFSPVVIFQLESFGVGRIPSLLSFHFLPGLGHLHSLLPPICGYSWPLLGVLQLHLLYARGVEWRRKSLWVTTA